MRTNSPTIVRLPSEPELAMPSRRELGVVTLGGLMTAVGLAGSPERAAAEDPDFAPVAKIQNAAKEPYQRIKAAIKGLPAEEKTKYLDDTRKRSGEIFDAKDTKADVSKKIDADSLAALKGPLKLPDGATLVKADIVIRDGKPVTAVMIKNGEKTESHTVDDPNVVRRVAANEYLKTINQFREYSEYVRTMCETHLDLLGTLP